MRWTSLDGRRMRVVATAENGEVSAQTIFTFEQSGSLFSARYRGGAIIDGYLIGCFDDENQGSLFFRYVQADLDGRIDAGVSTGLLEANAQGKLRLVEEFSWLTREGTGRNIFEEF